MNAAKSPSNCYLFFAVLFVGANASAQDDDPTPISLRPPARRPGLPITSARLRSYLQRTSMSSRWNRPGHRLGERRRGRAIGSRAREDAFVEAGHGLIRYDVMYNDSSLLDRARSRGHSRHDRGDRSAGQDRRVRGELCPRATQRNPHQGTERLEAGGYHTRRRLVHFLRSGMGEVLTMSAEMQGYTLATGDLSALRRGSGPEILVEGDPILFNPYGVIRST